MTARDLAKINSNYIKHTQKSSDTCYPALMTTNLFHISCILPETVQFTFTGYIMTQKHLSLF